MRATVKFEFGSEEIESFVTNVVVKSVAGTLGEIAEDPMQMQALLAGLQQGIGAVLSRATMVMRQGPPRGRAYVGAPYGAPMGAPGAPPGPYGPAGPTPPAGPYGAPQDPGNVRPIRDAAQVLDRCFAIEASRNTEAGWACHGCATFNGSQRTVCRYCGHTRCDPVITPPPAPTATPEETPEVPAP